MADRNLLPPRNTQQELSSFIGIAYSQRAKLREESGTNLNPVENPIAILEDGSYIVIDSTSTLTNEKYQDRYFRCPNINCKHALDGEMAELRLARGSINQWHFKHRKDLDRVEHCRESMIHHWASEIAGGYESISVPKMNGCMGEPTRNPSLLKRLECRPGGTSADATTIDRFRADAAIHDADGIIYVEITYTHNTTRTKEAHYRSIDARVLEIVIDDTAPFEEGAFVQHILHHAPRRWISHPMEYVEDQKRKSEAEARKERHARAFHEASGIVPDAEGRKTHEYVVRRDTVVAAHGLSELAVDPEPSIWFASNSERMGQWRLDVVEMAVLTPLRIQHGERHGGVFDPKNPNLWKNLLPIITPELVIIGNDESRADLLEGSSPAKDVERALKEVFADVAGVTHRPRLRRIEFDQDAIRSFGIAGVVLHRAGRIAECYGPAAPQVLQRWVLESERMPIRQTDHADGGREYVNRMARLAGDLRALMDRILVPRGRPSDLMGFDGLADIVDFKHAPVVQPEFRARQTDVQDAPSTFTRAEPSDGESQDRTESAPSMHGSIGAVQPEEPASPMKKRELLRRKLRTEQHPASLEERLRMTDEFCGFGPTGGPLVFLGRYRDTLGLSWMQGHGWLSERMDELDGMSRKEYVLNGSDDPDPWSRLHVAIAIQR